MSYQCAETTVEEDFFMKKFKYYKANKPKPSLSAVLFPENVDKQDEIVPTMPNNVHEDPRTRFLGLKTTKEWQTFYFSKHPGLILIKNPFTSIGQRYWIRKCLEIYPRKPNKVNIDIELSLNDWWQECFKNGECNKQLTKKLRWTTLGYHHNWDTKVYTEENKTPFPEDLSELSDVVAKYLGYSSFRAEAAIVNYYHMNSTLSGHTDHSEVNLEHLYSHSEYDEHIQYEVYQIYKAAIT
ncbi:nucleic acid dioxygenase ALKBH1-like [Manduca sexta]|uniref:nucleic acid dioxygenase ALKBH1-like n=1 Tax=Manduca sexta TaxID=7130 RepID=UPI00188F86FA|nr:nucleic acid dioxygenase ALKBH1-like [Manduca sexta]